MKFHRSFALALPLAFLSACGGGGGSSVSSETLRALPELSSGFQQTYTTSAAQGELLTYTVDTKALTYTYTVIKSQYGCEVPAAACHTGSGVLTQNADKSFSVSGSSSSKIYALQSGLLVGSVKLGDMPETPIIGIPSPITSSSALAGTYNYVSVQCPSKSQGAMSGCLGRYGSFKVVSADANKISYTTCDSDDIEKVTPVCKSTTAGTGSYDPALGVWKFSRTGSTNESYMAAFTASNGQKVAYLDFNDLGGYGYGQATVSERVTLSKEGLASSAGNWFLVNLGPGGNASSAIVTANADGTISTGGAMVLNSPWAGFVANTQDPRGMWILAGSGVFTYGGWTDLAGRAKYIVGMKM